MTGNVKHKRRLTDEQINLICNERNKLLAKRKKMDKCISRQIAKICYQLSHDDAGNYVESSPDYMKAIGVWLKEEQDV